MTFLIFGAIFCSPNLFWWRMGYSFEELHVVWACDGFVAVHFECLLIKDLMLVAVVVVTNFGYWLIKKFRLYFLFFICFLVFFVL
jgi:hypothetical protein